SARNLSPKRLQPTVRLSLPKYSQRDVLSLPRWLPKRKPRPLAKWAGQVARPKSSLPSGVPEARTSPVVRPASLETPCRFHIDPSLANCRGHKMDTAYALPLFRSNQAIRSLKWNDQLRHSTTQVSPLLSSFSRFPGPMRLME